MPRPRTPLAKAKATGRLGVNPGRFAGRNEPFAEPLGSPSGHMTELEANAWRMFQRELPWLTEADRALVEVACQLRARLIAGDLPIYAIPQLRQMLSAMGGTPVDRSKISVPEVPSDDLESEFFN